MLPTLADNKKCTGCLACIDSCRNNALTFSTHKDGHIYVSVNPNNCVGCKACERVCPIISKLPYRNSKYSIFHAAWNKDMNLRKNSASGGVFSAIASYILDTGGIVFGSAIENVSEIKHIYIENKKELSKLQGSKYAYSITVNCYKQAYEFLKNNRTVLFSGTGCQIAGLLSFLKNKTYKGKLITIDLICGGVPSRLLIDTFIKEEPYTIKTIKSFRTKDEGWKSHGFKYNLKIIDNLNCVHDYKNKKNLITDGFSLELTNRYSCYKCNFVGINRMSDFTIGDLWGDIKFPEEHHAGLSVLIAHTDSGLNLLNQLTKYLEINEIDAKIVIKDNKRIINGYNNNRFSLVRLFMPFLFRHLSYGMLKKLFAHDFSKFSPWMVYKIFQKFFLKIYL